MKVLILLSLVSIHTLASVCPIRDGSAANTVACTCGSETCTCTTGLICYSTYGGGSCRKTGLGAFGYTIEAGNTNCGSTNNQKPILDKASCEAAATSMGLDDVTAYELPRSNYPPGCFWHTSYKRLTYNTLSTSTTSCSSSYSCLCVTAPDCTHTNGATSNTNACLCGGTGCTPASGFFCYAEGSQCSTTIIPVCPIRDGSAANSVACTCGSETCTSTTGLICYSTYGGGSCRKTGFGAFGYTKKEGHQKCVDVSNRKPILDKATCEAAATSMDLASVVAYEISDWGVPPGCFMDGSYLYYNTLSTSTTSCSSSYSCLCVTAPDCTHTNGATSNTNACLCGAGVLCTAASGLYCDFSNSTCSSGDPCTSVDGSSLNTGVDCSCGTAACNSFNGMYCFAAGSFCNAAPVQSCTSTDGSAANPGPCKCGNVACTASTGLICYSTYGGGSCRKTGLGSFGYTKEEGNKMCRSESNRKPILDKALCEAAATSMDLGDVTAVEYSHSNRPPGCYWYSNGLYYNTLSTSTTSCSSRYPCLCATGPLCTHTNGATSNTNACLCGAGVLCTAASGLYCDSSSSTCSSGDPCTSVDGSSLNTGVDCSCGTAACNSFNGMFCHASLNFCSAVSICAVTDGSVANPGPCKCGNVACTASTGLICYSTYGGGSCRKTDFGPYGYVKLGQNSWPGKKCVDVSNRNPIMDKAACEAAATSMDLYEAAVHRDEVSYSWMPPGCIWRGSSLYYNTRSTSTELCSSRYPCLCATGPLCSKTDGTTANSAGCICGATVCTATTGQFCTSSTNTCNQLPTCTVTNGSAANNATCACGTTDCTDSNGLYCDASTNTCRPYASCTVTDGSAANNATCACGTNDCSNGLYCTSSTNTCRHAPCTVTDGSAANAGCCACGTNDCTDSNGLYCNASTNTCSNGGKLAVTSGSGCTIIGNCFQSRNFPNDYGSDENCSVTVQRVLAGETLYVVAFNTESGFDLLKVGGKTYSGTSGPSNVAVSENDVITWSSDEYLLRSGFKVCLRAACLQTNGSQVNSDTCKCGTAVCTAGGLFCNSPTNSCSHYPACSVVDGSAANNASCACGTNDCTNGTGLVCDYADNQCGPDCATVGTKQLCFVTSSVVDCNKGDNGVSPETSIPVWVIVVLVGLVLSLVLNVGSLPSVVMFYKKKVMGASSSPEASYTNFYTNTNKIKF